MIAEPDVEFNMTLKTRLFLWLYERFTDLGQWFISHCDMKPPPWVAEEMETRTGQYGETVHLDLELVTSTADAFKGGLRKLFPDIEVTKEALDELKR